MPEASVFRVLVTGANTGLGLATCKRLIDEFFASRPSTQILNLIITTRSSSKSSSTLQDLSNYASHTAKLKAVSNGRLLMSAYEMDLCSLGQVQVAARKIADDNDSLDVLICNAGISGWIGISWLKAVGDVLRHPIEAVTWPEFNIGSLGWRTEKQIPKNKEEEPPLGQVFCANVFGHYILAHLLADLLGKGGGENGRGRVIWTSSISTHATSLKLDDIQCLDRTDGYDSSKRLTDLLVLPSELPSLNPYTSQFWGSKSGTKPSMYVSQPGVVSTEIMPLPYVLLKAKEATFYIARWLGSPWHVITPHKGATPAVWLTLCPQTTLDEMEERDGKGKWGASCDWRGDERVRRSETEGWGYGGTVGAEEKFGRKARRTGTADLTREELEKFERDSEQCWKQLEEMRVDWLKRLESV